MQYVAEDFWDFEDLEFDIKNNLAAELGVADRGWFILAPEGSDGAFNVKERRVSGASATEWNIARSISRYDPNAEDSPYVSISYFSDGVDIIETPISRLTMNVGDCAIWHSSTPLLCNVNTSVHILNISFKEKYLTNQIGDIVSFSGMHFKSGEAFGDILKGFFSGLLLEWHSLSKSDLSLALLVARKLMVTAIVKRKSELVLDLHSRRMNKIIAVINERLYDPELNPRKIADLCHMSLRSLYLTFSKAGMTVGGYVRDRRLEDCRQIIVNKWQSISISQLALSKGFSDPSSFSRAFKKKFGVSPGDYRDWVSESKFSSLV